MLPQLAAGSFPHCLSLSTALQHWATCTWTTPHSAQLYPYPGQPMSPSPEGGHCSSPRCISHRLQPQCQGLTQLQALGGPFRPLHSNSWDCRRCLKGPSPAWAGRDTSRPVDSGVAPGDSARTMALPWAPRCWHQSLPQGLAPMFGLLRNHCRSCQLAQLPLPCLLFPAWAVLFNSLHRQHSVKEGWWHACCSAGQRHNSCRGRR